MNIFATSDPRGMEETNLKKMDELTKFYTFEGQNMMLLGLQSAVPMVENQVSRSLVTMPQAPLIFLNK